MFNRLVICSVKYHLCIKMTGYRNQNIKTWYILYVPILCIGI